MDVTRFISKYFPPTVHKDNVDWNEFERKYDEVQHLMKTQHLWFEDGHNYNFKPAIHKKIALGRIQFYVEFVDFLYEKYNERYYLLDYMSRINRGNGQESLLYYITDAQEIHINLEGVSKKDLRRATIGINKLAKDKAEINAKYTTAWEINQVFHRGLLDITWFHTGSSMTRRQAYRAMGKQVPFNRILNDNKNLVKENKKNIENLEELELVKKDVI